MGKTDRAGVISRLNYQADWRNDELSRQNSVGKFSANTAMDSPDKPANDKLDSSANNKRGNSANSPAREIFLNRAKPLIMHIDFNSCFATTEQQARPSLRGLPLGITNRISPNCCMIAASIEAKQCGVKVGMGRREAESVCPELIILESDPPKYRWAYRNLLNIMQSYSPKTQMKSIDEGWIDFTALGAKTGAQLDLIQIGQEIKARIKHDLGRWMRCNVGIGTSRWAAKMAASLHKPDGLDVLDADNLVQILSGLELTDLTGINKRYARRLGQHKIYSVKDFFAASQAELSQIFGSKVIGRAWFNRLRGFEVDDFATHQRQIGRQFVLEQRTNDDEILLARLQYLAQTTAMKLRYSGLDARGVSLWLAFDKAPTFGDARPLGFWQTRHMWSTGVYSDQAVFARVRELFAARPRQTVTALGLSCYGLQPTARTQSSVLDADTRADNLMARVDEVNARYGNFVVTYADALESRSIIKQKIPFGSTRYVDFLNTME